MHVEIRMLCTFEERRKAQRLFYEAYIEEMGRYLGKADHENKLYTPELFENFRIFGAIDDTGELHGLIVILVGTDAPMPEDYIEDYELSRFQDLISPEKFAFTEYLVIRRTSRGTSVGMKLMSAVVRYVFENDIPMLFVDSEPHLVKHYFRLGLRSHYEPYFEEQFGLICPIVFFPDIDYLKQMRSPFADLPGAPHKTSAQIKQLVQICESSRPLVGIKETLTEAEWSEICEQAQSTNAHQVSIFSDMNEEQVDALMKDCTVVTCYRDLPIFAKGQKGTRSIAFLLSGRVKVLDAAGKVIAIRQNGDVLGETAALMETEQPNTLIAMEDDTRLLFLGQQTLNQMLRHDSEVASRFFHNLSRLICSNALSTTNEPQFTPQGDL
ncbi:MAG: cyclic nucleotide-binding domain-containing protein [Myxococcales bacterium]|nr:cyclic nucleotide-binding domain-containing protein [Myxococcales bacterium]MCB9642278.1 cyclic nucleotide-binding domain-containing protein [Myxococcales bacterium]